MTECNLLCRIVPKAQYAMTEGHCSIQLGIWGCCKPPSRFRAERWRGVKPLEALKNLHFTVQKEAKKHLCGAFFSVLNTIIKGCQIQLTH